MKGVKLIILFLLITVNTVAQDWYKQISDQVKLVAKIQNHESWKSVYQFGKNDLKISEESLFDIQLGKQLENTKNLKYET